MKKLAIFFHIGIHPQKHKTLVHVLDFHSHVLLTNLCHDPENITIDN